MKESLYQHALEYHRAAPAGKIAIAPTKPLATQEDLVLAYSPGVAAASLEIYNNPGEAISLTARANLVAVVSNGTAVLGLGNIGPLAAKPVMEGKAVLFKKFAGVDVFDLEISEEDPKKLIDIIASLEPTFGGINLEDIKAPECFEIERALQERLHIPVFHDDQHGTAIIVAAALQNALKVVGKKIQNIKLVTAGAGAAALATLNMLVDLGLKRENITVTDSQGVLYKGRKERMDPEKEAYATASTVRSLEDALKGADMFLGLSKANLVTADMVKIMAAKPIVFALANPNPEIRPEDVYSVAPEAVVATGRSDYPNQVNNVLCFPFIFRGALDVGARKINKDMKLACAQALADLVLDPNAKQIIPNIFDPRLVVELPLAVAQAAMDSGVATRPIEDMGTYKRRLLALARHETV